MHSRGIRESPRFAITEKYVYRETPEASHQKILGLVEGDRQSVLDLGCGAGYLAEALAVRENRVVGVDARRAEGVEGRLAVFLQADLDTDPVPWSGEPFDIVIAADVLEHLREPGKLLEQCQSLIDEDGSLIVSVPNVAHWSVRLGLLFGRFAYTARGILDHSHLRFYTLSSIRAELADAGFRVDRVETTTAPFGELLPSGLGSRFGRLLERLDALGARWRPTLFAYQFVLRARNSRG
jgi:2-polyprenyl-3-methyl-5-hydroxy-6-metoxy-1,4-benzoquinol methylase